MLTHWFYLTAIWLVLALGMTLLFGTRLRHGHWLFSLFYLGVLLVLGDLIALVTFGDIFEIGLATVLVLFIGIVFIAIERDWNAFGQTLYLFTLTTTALYLGYAFAITAFSPLTPIAFLFALFLFTLELAALVLSLSYAFELLDVLTRIRWHGRAEKKTLGSNVPMVSLHVPAYNEPPELVEKTLRQLAKLDYPRFEVILIDNNTPDEGTWQPLARVCQELGFKCLHLARWPGFKSGALNFALEVTDPDAEIIGVIDSDYMVDGDFLRAMVPYFEDPQVAFVQCPQDYRDYDQNRYTQSAYDSYKYFFALSMPARNEHNAIIFCGTMGLLRKKVLQEIGGWDEWCITEDAEASLRILSRGYKAKYVDHSYGHGLMPLNFEGMKKQRFRWAFGGVQIIKKHWGKLMPWSNWVDPSNRLTFAQKYFYLTSGLQWFNELLTMLFTFVVLTSILLTLAGQTALLRPTYEAFVILPLVLIGTNLLRALWGLKQALRLSWGRAIYALTMWFSLTWVVAMACVQALVRERGVFLRTPKVASDWPLLRALGATSWESMLGLVCAAAGAVLLLFQPSTFAISLAVLAASQAFIYFSAPFQAMLSLQTAEGRRAWEPNRGDIGGTVVNERHAGLWLGLAALVLLLLAFVASAFADPGHLPGYSIFKPAQALAPPAPIITTPTRARVPATQTPTPQAQATGTATTSPTASGTASPSTTHTLLATPTIVTPTTTMTPTPFRSVTPVILPSLTSPPTPSPLPPATATTRPSPTPAAPTVTPTPTSCATPITGAGPTPTPCPTATLTP